MFPGILDMYKEPCWRFLFGILVRKTDMSLMTQDLASPIFIDKETDVGYYKSNLKDLLEATSMSLREIARYTGVSATTLSSLSSNEEKAPARIDTATVLRLAYFLTHRLGRIIRPEDIFEYVPPPELKG
jgi:DNA-binding Xre family transcriptional regulator